MAGTDNHCNSGSRRVNMKIRGGVPSFNRNLFRHQLSCLLVTFGTMAIELCVFKKKTKHGKNIFGYNVHIWCFFY